LRDSLAIILVTENPMGKAGADPGGENRKKKGANVGTWTDGGSGGGLVRGNHGPRKP